MYLLIRVPIRIPVPIWILIDSVLIAKSKNNNKKERAYKKEEKNDDTSNIPILIISATHIRNTMKKLIGNVCSEIGCNKVK